MTRPCHRGPMTPLEIRSGSTIAQVLPELGFNCFSLVVDGFDYLHQSPDLLGPGSPTRSGIPILFPWPNRMAGSHFTWQGQQYSAPVTEPATGASLHGFACRSPWRVVDSSHDTLVGEWVLSQDSPETAANWPADAGIRVTYRVEPTRLNVTAHVFSADGRDLPFGLGFHPYFRVPGPFGQWLLQCDATQTWPLRDMVPAGHPVPVPPELDFRKARRVGEHHLDDVLTGLPEAEGMQRRAALLSMASALTITSDPSFREFVLFTPSSRDAVAIEPYTCTTNAMNLPADEGGWRVLPSGETATFAWQVDIA